jgi:hypothetical protein
VTGPPEAFAQFIQDETRNWSTLLKKVKVDVN